LLSLLPLLLPSGLAYAWLSPLQSPSVLAYVLPLQSPSEWMSLSLSQLASVSVLLWLSRSLLVLDWLWGLVSVYLRPMEIRARNKRLPHVVPD
jgi:hypothetical protein